MALGIGARAGRMLSHVVHSLCSLSTLCASSMEAN